MKLTAEFAHLAMTGLSDTERLARLLAGLLRRGDAIMLQGGLGAGKSTLARALIRALTTPEEEVPSPTFTLVQIYPTCDFDLYHFDLYRLTDPGEAYELGLEEAITDGAALVEWPERLNDDRPGDRLDLEILAADADSDLENGPRRVILSGHGSWAARLPRLMQRWNASETHD